MADVKEYLKGFDEQLNRVGIVPGDILWFSSDITAFYMRALEEMEGDMQHIQNEIMQELINDLQEYIGEQGTLVLPVFSWQFCREGAFSIKDTPGEVGILPNWVLFNRSEFERTRHAIYSFVVWGKGRDELIQLDNQDAFGEGSPLAYFRDKNAKQLFFDIEAYRGLTMCHCAEQYVGVPYRHPKYFFGNYIDVNGVEEFRMYSMYTRDLDIYMDVGVRNKYLISSGLAQEAEWKDVSLVSTQLGDCFNAIVDDIRYNNGQHFLYFEDYDLDLGSKQTMIYESNLERYYRRMNQTGET